MNDTASTHTFNAGLFDFEGLWSEAGTLGVLIFMSRFCFNYARVEITEQLN